MDTACLAVDRFFRQQHLCGELTVFRKKFLIDHHQAPLPYCCTCLFDRTSRLLTDSKDIFPDTDCTGRYYNYLFSAVSEIDQYTDKFLQFFQIDVTGFCIGDSGGSHFDDDSFLFL